MDSKEFKTVFGEVANTNDFKKAFGGWDKESPECIAILELQKSNFGDYYQLLIKIFIQGAFEKTYIPSKDLIKSSMGHITTNETPEYKAVFDFDEPMEDEIFKLFIGQHFINQSKNSFPVFFFKLQYEPHLLNGCFTLNYYFDVSHNDRQANRSLQSIQRATCQKPKQPGDIDITIPVVID